MESYLVQSEQQHSLLTNQVKKEPVKEVSNLLSDSPSISWDDLRGLSWILFEEEIQ